jgi:hypothetical protein
MTSAGALYPQPDGRSPPIPWLPRVRITRHDRPSHEMTIGINENGKVAITDTTNGAVQMHLAKL